MFDPDRTNTVDFILSALDLSYQRVRTTRRREMTESSIRRHDIR